MRFKPDDWIWRRGCPGRVRKSQSLQAAGPDDTQKALIEARYTRANNTRPQQLDIAELQPKKTPADFFREPEQKDESGRLGFKNKRAEYYWRMREALDPKNNEGVCLPPGNEVRSDLAAARFKVVGGGKIQVEAKEEIVKRIGRSPDVGDAIVLAWTVEASPDWAPLELPSRKWL